MLTEQKLRRLQDDGGVTLADAMASVGMEPHRLQTARWDPATVAAFLELHIEQARVLESGGQAVGLVDVISGSTRLKLDILGRAEHSGGTPMELRRDAMAAAAEIILGVEGLANDHRHRGTRATVGRLEVRPNNITTIPGRVNFAVDVRDVDTDRQRAAAREIVERAYWICERRGVELRVEVMADTSPAVLPVWLRDLMGKSCSDLGVGFRTLASGAGHDAAIVSRLVPAGMLLIPCQDGLSHVPEEWASVSDIVRGVEVLFHVVLKLDAFLARWG